MEDVFELRITWKNSFQQIGIGIVMSLFVLGVAIWFVFPYLREPNMENGLFSLLIVGIALLTGTIFFAGFLLYFAGALIYVGIRDIDFMRKNKGILYRMDKEGFVYHENWQLLKKTWQEVSDVGLFKQESKKVKVLYKYQVKFSDGTCHTFDLRGSYPTKEFLSKIEEYWLKYMYE
ncbi:hypothetical protein RV11_GL002697 [Enterococcus phoeniculicola]|jgi:hypothetical protein|uniref:Uncharacterized protein n=1 Tax=Enterococcus phoeniculicola ATCC BAA-412 TaxID=1158610 RepID=R3WIQ5_9ENTE|nr:hypothetical protein [Enterococcus phoeniculicola]EOL41775.1 hypothetical protein UC3_03340 [Enterococcus phoeniculicola ATCC BAA-412]EOT78731.1 hypothetical protein I589_00236 [Enterococcus phoeniculicola ATCC BAA-412]OJG72558.1 hypothetical protein RV11_GL002697 [Enterococcus phoeniculicola]